MTSEQSIQNDVQVALSARGHKVWRANAGTAMSANGGYIKLLPKGFPDLFGFNGKTGQFFAIEMKNETGRLRPDQKTFGNMLSNQPVAYGVARSVQQAINIVEGN
ncbi:VRR-NUC domain protein [Weissella ceti]|uniref:VRR-NUC domain-containing protein n=1 Tax=Weissella ceti TaxID=759620 RepID=UPI0004F7D191|nr:VRR-NUC domain-containing protein [Weissella ceti]AIM64215.1 VRR-NUC domain protein [Weissella ceti]